MTNPPTASSASTTINAGIVIPPEVKSAPDCGMKYLTREAAFGKLCALAQAAEYLRSR